MVQPRKALRIVFAAQQVDRLLVAQLAVLREFLDGRFIQRAGLGHQAQLLQGAAPVDVEQRRIEARRARLAEMVGGRGDVAEVGEAAGKIEQPQRVIEITDCP